MHGEVTVHIDAPPAKVWELVSDVTRVGRYSPETFEAEWLDGATAPAVGVRFRGHVKRNGRGPTYWTTCTILTCEPERDFAFGVGSSDKPVNTWRYTLTPSGAGTDVTESFTLRDIAPMHLYWRLFGKARGATNERNMQATLERMKAEVENPD